MSDPKNNYSYHKEGANLSLIKIESFHCWRCGVNMAGTTPDDMKTEHHSIPEELKPVRNISVPVCRKCHGEINNSQSMQPHDKNRLSKKIEALEKQFNMNLESIKKEFAENK